MTKNQLKKKLEEYMSGAGIEARILTKERGIIEIVIIDWFLGDRVLTSSEYINHIPYMKASDNIAAGLVFWYKYYNYMSEVDHVIKLTRVKSWGDL